MSLDPHWYSTLFGWYNFASYMCGFLSMAILVVTYLKYKGHLINVNENHLHNLSMLLFGFSVFYTYLWFSQYMLIWYGNIPEDTMYFYKRFQVPLFKVLFFVTLIINFAFPFLFFVKRKAKRNFWLMNIAAVILIIGHYFDFYLMVMPEPNFPIHHEASHDEAHTGDHNKTAHVAEGHAEASHTAEHASPASDANGHKHETVQTYATLGLPEAFIFLGFVGLFLFTVLSVLSRHRIVPTKNPFLEESLRHQY
jgi:hypothetical protein